MVRSSCTAPSFHCSSSRFSHHWLRVRKMESPRLAGFANVSTMSQLAVEKKFDAQLRADDQKEWMEQMASAPNHVGSPHDKANAEFLLAKYSEWDWDARIEEFEVL